MSVKATTDAASIFGTATAAPHELVRPWYVYWPPQARQGLLMPPKHNADKAGSIVPWILLGLIIVGAVLVIIPHLVPRGGSWEFLWESLPHFGIAFLISGILGLTVDRYTRKRFTHEVAKDVFQATIGHLLPEEFQDEMRWIYGQEAICEQHNQDVQIQSNRRLYPDLY